MPAKPTLSVIVPVRNEEEGIVENVGCIARVLGNLDIKASIVLIDDGSLDKSWDKIKELHDNKEYKIKALRLSRNFGKDAAILCGLEQVNAEYYLVIDSDGEHPFEKIPEFLGKIGSGDYDVVHGIKISRNSGPVYSFTSKLYSRIWTLLSDTDLYESSDYKLFTRDFRNALLKIGDSDFFFRGIAANIGFRRSYVHFSENHRDHGSSSWNIFGLIRYGLRNIISFTNIPLYIILALGVFALMLATLLGLKAIFELWMGDVPEGYLTILILLLTNMGLLMTALGILGVYAAKIFDATRNRPRYLIEEKL